MDYLKQYELWCNDKYFDDETKRELRNLNEEEIKERFYKELEFGTGGLRGELGAGTNRMNIYTVKKATQGLANYIIEENGQKKGVAIAYDSRNMSPEFAKETALCFCANGIKTYLFDSLRPTPELSFAVRKLGCMAGVVITASHNPKEYNGYKVYWEDGGQITAPKDKEIIAKVASVKSYESVKTMTEQEAKGKELFHIIGENIDKSYLEELKKLVLNQRAIKQYGKEICIVYTPLHGSGNVLVQRILKELGFTNVHIVKEQQEPDGNFTTVKSPNPEEPSAFTLALKLAKEVDADLIFGTDPDADRLGVYVKKSKGEYEALSGNMSGALLCEYQLSQKKEQKILPQNGAVVTTIVSGNMAKSIAKEYDVTLIETLTGFKYIGEQIKLFEQKNTMKYLFGFEESYGCLIGTYARDKDAVVAAMVLCEAAAYYKGQGKTLWEQINYLYEKYGYFTEKLFTMTLKGQEGLLQIQNIMEKTRNNPPLKIGTEQVITFYDYEKEQKNLPKANVLYFEIENDGWCCIRPSGTEPKIKIYTGVKGTSLENANEKLEQLMRDAITLLH